MILQNCFFGGWTVSQEICWVWWPWGSLSSHSHDLVAELTIKTGTTIPTLQMRTLRLKDRKQPTQRQEVSHPDPYGPFMKAAGLAFRFSCAHQDHFPLSQAAVCKVGKGMKTQVIPLPPLSVGSLCFVNTITMLCFPSKALHRASMDRTLYCRHCETLNFPVLGEHLRPLLTVCHCSRELLLILSFTN